MSKKSPRIATMIEGLHRPGFDPHYLGYFECFNQQLFYEAHDVLEELWLAQRKQPNDLFYKGLIQLAGAFVHLQKNRLGPATAVFRLAENNLKQYPLLHEQFNVGAALEMITKWLWMLEGAIENPLSDETAPKLALL